MDTTDYSPIMDNLPYGSGKLRYVGEHNGCCCASCCDACNAESHNYDIKKTLSKYRLKRKRMKKAFRRRLRKKNSHN
jgi:hypothetical protein